MVDFLFNSNVFIVISNITVVVSAIGILMSMLVFFVVAVLKKPMRHRTKINIDLYKRQTKYNPDLYVECDKAHELLRYATGTRKWQIRLRKSINDVSKHLNCFNRKWEKVLKVSYKKCKGLSLEKLRYSITSMKEYISSIHRAEGKIVCIGGVNVYSEGINAQSKNHELDDYLLITDLMKSKTIFVSSTAGNGKSFLLAKVAESLFDSKRTVLFLSGRDMGSDPESYLWDAVFANQYTKTTSMVLLKIMSETAFVLKRPIVFIVDAINENDSNEFKNGLIQLLIFLQDFRGIKTIVSCRKEYVANRFYELFDTLGVREVKDEYNFRNRYVGTESTQFLELNKNIEYVNHVFIERYRRFYKYGGEISDFVISRLTHSSRLTIRMFFESFSSSHESVRTFNRVIIYENYINRVSKNDNNVWEKLMDLGRKMLELNQFYNIPRHNLLNTHGDYTDTDDALITYSPLESVQEPNLATIHEDAFSFSFDELRDFILSKVLVQDVADKGEIIKRVQSLRTQDRYYHNYELSPYEGVINFLYLFYYSIKDYEVCEVFLNSFIQGHVLKINRVMMNPEKIYAGLQLIFDCGGPTMKFEKKYIERLLSINNPSVFLQVLDNYDFNNDWGGLISLLVELDREVVKAAIYSFLRYEEYSFMMDSPAYIFKYCKNRKGMYTFLLFASVYGCIHPIEIIGIIDDWKPDTTIDLEVCPSKLKNSILQKDKTVKEMMYGK